MRCAFLAASRKCPRSRRPCWSSTAPRTRWSTSPTAWRCSSFAPRPWSRCGWRGRATTTLNSTRSTWSACDASSDTSSPEAPLLPPPPIGAAKGTTVVLWHTRYQIGQFICIFFFTSDTPPWLYYTKNKIITHSRSCYGPLLTRRLSHARPCLLNARIQHTDTTVMMSRNYYFFSLLTVLLLKVNVMT